MIKKIPLICLLILVAGSGFFGLKYYQSSKERALAPTMQEQHLNTKQEAEQIQTSKNNLQMQPIALPENKEEVNSIPQAISKENISQQEKDDNKSAFSHFFNLDFWKDSKQPQATELTNLPQSEEVTAQKDSQATLDAASEENLTEKEKVFSLAEYEVQDNEKIIFSKVKKNDTAGSILDEWITHTQLYKALEVSKEIHPLTKINLDKPYAVTLDEHGYFKRFEYEKNNEDILVLDAELILKENSEGSIVSDYEFTAKLVPITYEVELSHVEAEIEPKGSLSSAATSVGETDVLVSKLENILAYQIDFFTDVQPGDSFEVLVEKKYRNEEFKNYGSVLTATYSKEGRNYTAYRFRDADGIDHYYDENGEAFERLLLKAPLEYTRISSGYTMNRKHPILGVVRPHQGIDYAAPTGTPVRTVGDGIVTFSGTQGGYGKIIIIKHSNGFETQYAHLSKRLVKKGEKVLRGEIIGNVGSTGLSTGPHLDYRIKQNGKFINPNSIDIPKAPALEGKEKEEFLAFVANTKAYLNGEQALSSYIAPKEENNSF